jgi:hypothetical protein
MTPQKTMDFIVNLLSLARPEICSLRPIFNASRRLKDQKNLVIAPYEQLTLPA